MPGIPTRPALVLLGALLCLTACSPTATVSVSPTATVSVSPTATIPPAPTATPTPVLAPTPTTVPAGWKVLATTYFSLAYPPDWTLDGGTSEGVQSYIVWAPAKQSDVMVTAVARADAGSMTSYCQPESEGAHPTTFANLPMTFQLTGLGNTVRVWSFANAQQTLYLLSAGDIGASAAVQAQHTAILATFRPDDADPWHC